MVHAAAGEHNAANEIDDDDDHTNAPMNTITASVGANWLDPTCDAAGNMTGAGAPDDPANTRHWYQYDAWSRLVGVYQDDGDGVNEVAVNPNPETPVATYEYDGRNYRIEKTAGGVTLDYYYTESWQCLEVHEAGDTANPLEQYVWHPYYGEIADIARSGA